MNYIRGQATFIDIWLAKTRATMADKLIDAHSPLWRQGRILDIGCGYHPFFLLQTNFKEKYGLDPNTELEGGKINLIKQSFSGTALPFTDSFFQTVVSLAVIEHLNYQAGFNLLAQAQRILSPGGGLILTTPSPWSDKLLRFLAGIGLISKQEIDEHQSVYSLKTLKQKLIQAGFRSDSIKTGYFECFLNQWVMAVKSETNQTGENFVDRLKNFIFRHKKIFKFLVVGTSGAAIDFALLAILVEIFHWLPLVANLVSFSIAVVSNFFLNKFWTWRDTSLAYRRQFIKFFITSVLGLGINTLLMWLLLTGGLYYLWAKVIVSLVVAVWNYSVNNWWTFGAGKQV